jgi:hypothetical protein
MALFGMNYVNPESVLARTAWEMVQTHAGGLGPSDGMSSCPVCGEPLPCTVGRGAAEVVTAAGLAESPGVSGSDRLGDIRINGGSDPQVPSEDPDVTDPGDPSPGAPNRTTPPEQDPEGAPDSGAEEPSVLPPGPQPPARTDEPTGNGRRPEGGWSGMTESDRMVAAWSACSAVG